MTTTVRSAVSAVIGTSPAVVQGRALWSPGSVRTMIGPMGGLTRRQLPWLLVTGGVVWTWLAVREQRLGRPWTFLVSTLLPGLLMVGAGLVIWSRRPHNRCWWLLVGAGFAGYVGNFEHASNRNVALGAFAF